MFKKLGEFAKLVRIEHALMLAIAVFIGEAIALGGIPPLGLVLLFSLLVPALSEMGSFALNDYVDVETDRINKKVGRPLVKGTLSPDFALKFSAGAFILSTMVALAINWMALVVGVVFNVLAVLYNLKLKDLPLLGNIYIAATMGIPFIFGAVVFGMAPTMTIWVIAAMGFVAGLAREIVKTVEDMEGDAAARKSRTLPMIVGRANALAMASSLFLAFIPLSIVPFVGGLTLSLFSGMLLGIADLGILWLAIYIMFSKEEKALRKATRHNLVFLFIGLMALLAASLGY
ncbi:MAG: UbiA family prenyltransferase [Candidatus Micrarchaeota archaeon]